MIKSKVENYAIADSSSN